MGQRCQLRLERRNAVSLVPRACDIINRVALQHREAIIIRTTSEEALDGIESRWYDFVHKVVPSALCLLMVYRQS